MASSRTQQRLVYPGVFMLIGGIISVISPALRAQEASTQAAPASQPGQSPSSMVAPHLSPEDGALLISTARRAFRAALRDSSYKGYQPPELRDRRGTVHLTLRKNGMIDAEAESTEMPIVDATISAASLLAKVVRKTCRSVESWDDHGLELEWLGSSTIIAPPYFREGGGWADELLHSFEPGVEAIGVQLDDKIAWTRPSQIISRNYSPDLALKAAEARVGLKQVHKLKTPEKIKYLRCWAHHLWQPAPSHRGYLLLRGEELLSQEDVERTLATTIARGGAYLQFRHNDNGSFADEYLPSGDTYNERNSAPVQMAALYSLAHYLNHSDKESASEILARSFESFGKYVTPLEKFKGSLFTAPGHPRHLENSARLLLACAEMGGTDDKASELRKALTQGLLSSQQEDGTFAIVVIPDPLDPTTTQPDQPQLKNDAISDAWICLALARAAQIQDSSQGERIERALNRTARYYQRQAPNSINREALLILARAFALHYEKSNDAKLSDFVFLVADQLANVQTTSQTCPYPELVGGFNFKALGQVGADSATCLSVLIDALRLAQRVGDAEREARYREVAKRATRFVMQLEVRPPGTYFMRTPKAALGGIRIAPWNNRIRVDDCANALVAFMAANDTLFK